MTTIKDIEAKISVGISLSDEERDFVFNLIKDKLKLVDWKSILTDEQLVEVYEKVK